MGGIMTAAAEMTMRQKAEMALHLAGATMADATHALDTLAAAGLAVVAVPGLDVQPDRDAPGVYLRYETGAQRDDCVAEFDRATPPRPLDLMDPKQRQEGCLYLIQRTGRQGWQPARWAPLTGGAPHGYGPWWVPSNGYWCHVQEADVSAVVGPLPASAEDGINAVLTRHRDQARAEVDAQMRRS